MILPSKHLDQDRALLTVGAQILSRLKQPETVSALWEQVSREAAVPASNPKSLRFDAFVLALDLLFLMGAIQLDKGLIRRATP
jgi:hypothetical protein